MIRIKNLSKSYGTNTVLNDVSIEIQEGSLTSFIGSNGAGKSTLLSIAARLLKQDSGIIEIDGKDLTDWDTRDLARNLSILRQSNNIDMKLKVEELVAFGRFPYTKGNLTAQDKEMVEQAIEFMNLQEIRDQYINELSGGQQQRAYIAMIIAQDTKYILLDEPLNNLDMKHSVDIMRTFRRLCDELGKTVLLVIHDINFASVYSDRIAALCHGKLKYHDTVEKMMDETRLQDLFGLNFEIFEQRGRKICSFYDPADCTNSCQRKVS